MSCTFFEYCSKGVSRSNLYSLQRASRIALVKLDLSVQDCQPMTVIAPSLILSDGLGMIKSSANSILYPRPKQTGHAPKGLLKEKLLGSISSMLIPQSGQAKLWLKFIASPPMISTVSRPSARLSTLSTESVRRFSIPGFTTRRSTIISMLCLIFLSRVISSDNSYRFPSMRTRT